MKTFAVLVGVIAVAGFGFAQSLVVQPKVPIPVVQPEQAAVAQPQFQAGGVFQTFPGGTPLSTIHIAVGGTPMAGSYVAFEEVAHGFNAELVGGVMIRSDRVWTVTLQSNSDPNANGGVYVRRHLDFATNAVIWTGGGAFGPSGRGAYSGYSQGGQLFGSTFALNGADFNCSGGSGFVGNPAWGGGGNITLTVTP